ncbi:MAG: hypothetical protein H6744_12355 [Deltaproteobacteria bacterium]|nr:hypothetical protein [Deltaproteobacteria bacterium]
MKRAMGAALSCALMALAGCTEGAQETVSFDSAHAATGAVFLETFAGDVVVDTDPGAIRVAGTILLTARGFPSTDDALAALHQVEIDESGTAEALEIRVSGPALRGLRTVRADLFLSVPPGVLVSALSADGLVSATDIDFDSLETARGGVELVATRGPGLVRASGGEIVVDGHEGGLDLRTSDAPISIFAARGDVRAVTSNGMISARVVPPAGAELFFATTNAGVDLALPVNFGADLSATTDGDIYIEGLDFFPTRDSLDLLEGELAGGGGALDVRTTHADIRIHRR